MKTGEMDPSPGQVSAGFTPLDFVLEDSLCKTFFDLVVPGKDWRFFSPLWPVKEEDPGIPQPSMPKVCEDPFWFFNLQFSRVWASVAQCGRKTGENVVLARDFSQFGNILKT